MPIQVVCQGCKSRFSVSDRFAGRTGPCPKCKRSITIPRPAVQSVTIHEPEPPATSSRGTGGIPTAPIVSTERPVSRLQFALVGGGVIACLLTAGIARVWWPGQAPAWALAAAAIGLAFPCVAIGYRLARDRELEPYRGRELAVRATICALAYAALWGVRALVPPEMTAETWQWLYITPLFFGLGALASFATLDLEWGAATAHFSLYLLVTALLRWLAGFAPF